MVAFVIVSMLFAAFASTGDADRCFDVRSFGAKGDGIAKDTAAIQSAIDAAALGGGGVVQLPCGRYVSGSIFLKNNVTLSLADGAVIEGSKDPNDYNAVDVCPQNFDSIAENMSGGHLILAISVTNVTLCGKGRIEGNGIHFMTNGFDKARIGKRTGKNGLGGVNRQDAILWRPGQMVYFVECKNVRLEGVELADSPYWTAYLHGCDGIVAKGLKIRSSRPPEIEIYNADGLSIDCCRNVDVFDCDIRTSDDALCLRASLSKKLLYSPAETSNVRVRNCRLSSLQDGVRIGVGEGVISNCHFSGIQIYDTTRAINFSSTWFPSRGVDFNDITFTNVVSDSTSSFLRVHRLKSTDSDIRDLRFTDIRATQGKPSYIWSRKGKPFENIVLENVELNNGIEVVNVKGFRLEGGTLKRIELSPKEYDQRSEDIEKFRKMLY